MRPIFAAAAMFIMLAGLAFCMFSLWKTDIDPTMITFIFGACFLTCLLFLAAGAFIKGETIKLFLNAIPSTGGGRRG